MPRGSLHFAFDRPFQRVARSVPMAKRGEQAAGPDDIEELRHEVADLKDHVRLLVDAIDELREELQWLTRNGLPSRDPPAPVPVLKQMAADPCADDWGERLVIVRGDTPPIDKAPASSAPEPAAKPTAGKLFAEPGDQGRLF